MNLRSTIFLLPATLAIGLLLNAINAQAATVERLGEYAYGIYDLEVGGVTYDVTFPRNTASKIYGNAGQFLDFNTEAEARAAIEAAAAVLTAAGGIQLAGGSPIFRVGYELEGEGLTAVVKVWEAVRGDGGELDVWARVPDPDVFPFQDDGTFANFTVTEEPPPEPTPEPTPQPPPPDNAVQVGAQACQYMNINQAKFLEYRSEGVLNTNTVEQWIVCPVGAEVGADNVNSRVRILNNSNVTAETQCLWKLTNQSGNTISSKSLKQSIPPGESYDLFASNLNYEPGVTLTVSCKLPPQFLALSLTLEY